MELRFRDDFDVVLVDWLTRERRTVTGYGDLELEVLSPPHAMSPFLTVVESFDASRDGLPWRVHKLLAVPEEDPSEPFWRGVLERERDRWRRELAKRLQRSGRVETLGLPLSVPRDGHQELVEIAELGPLRRLDLLEETTAESSLRFPYLTRPYIAWPRLHDVGYSAEELRSWWAIYCEEHDVAEHLREPLFPHFCDEALIDGQKDVLLTSAWRLEVFL